MQMTLQENVYLLLRKGWNHLVKKELFPPQPADARHQAIDQVAFVHAKRLPW